ncbi:MAG: hypothetical protein ACJ74G_14870 [Blastocatellia bacterium]
MSMASGCHARSRSAVETEASSPQQAANVPAARESPEETNEKYYREFGTVTWDVDSKGTFVQARIETIKVLLSELPQKVPFSRITITSLTNKSVIYVQNLDEFPLSIYTRDVNGDQNEELVVVWTAGAVANQMQILKVGSSQAQMIFDKGYRVDAALVDLGGKGLDILVTDGESGGGPFETTRFVWRDGHYQASGKIPSQNFENTIKRLFAIPQQAKKKSR